MNIDKVLEQLEVIPTYGYSKAMIEAVEYAKWTLYELRDFVRTPQWTVSMLEDIGAMIITSLPDHDEDDLMAWKGH